MRSFGYASRYTNGNLALALAPGLTPLGVVASPEFFDGYVIYPQVVARGLLVLADVAASRYYNFVPESQRDPILTGQGDRLRAECFSVCNGVYARLDLLQEGLEGKIGYGTTNVDIGAEMRSVLSSVRKDEDLHIKMGDAGLAVDAGGSQARERPVKMPDRWVRALGNAAEMHRGMEPVFSLTGAQAQAFVAGLPPASGKLVAGWVTPARTGIKLLRQGAKDTVYIAGLHRLSALKRVMPHIKGVTFFQPTFAEAGTVMVVAELPACRITLSLTAEAWRGYSGEGALLSSLVYAQAQKDAARMKLSFDGIIRAMHMAQTWNMDTSRAEDALALLAVSGKLGYDATDTAYFHRELPEEPGRILKDNPRLLAAQKLTDDVTLVRENEWNVPSKGADYRVRLGDSDRYACSCTWYLRHGSNRGPCKHILAVQIKTGEF